MGRRSFLGCVLCSWQVRTQEIGSQKVRMMLLYGLVDRLLHSLRLCFPLGRLRLLHLGLLFWSCSVMAMWQIEAPQQPSWHCVTLLSAALLFCVGMGWFKQFGRT